MSHLCCALELSNKLVTENIINDDIELQIDGGSGTSLVDVNVDLNRLRLRLLEQNCNSCPR